MLFHSSTESYETMDDPVPTHPPTTTTTLDGNPPSPHPNVHPDNEFKNGMESSSSSAPNESSTTPSISNNNEPLNETVSNAEPSSTDVVVATPTEPLVDMKEVYVKLNPIFKEIFVCVGPIFFTNSHD